MGAQLWLVLRLLCRPGYPNCPPLLTHEGRAEGNSRIPGPTRQAGQRGIKPYKNPQREDKRERREGKKERGTRGERKNETERERGGRAWLKPWGSSQDSHGRRRDEAE